MNVDALDVVYRTLQKKSRHLCGIIEKNHSRFGDAWIQDFNRTFGSIFEEEEDLELATLGYARFSNSAMRSQARFQKTRVYERLSFEDVTQSVYLNPDYMTREYLPGLMLSHLLWPHHYAQLQFFRQVVQRNSPRRFAEIGVGSGIYSLATLTLAPEAVGVGIDISPSSLAFAQKLLKRVNYEERYSFLQRDVTLEKIELSLDFTICVELLEHLENPQKLLRGLRNLISRRNTGFVTAALNAAHADHIYLYSLLRDVQAQVEDAGFVVEETFYEEAYPRRFADELIPAVAAFVVSAA